MDKTKQTKKKHSSENLSLCSVQERKCSLQRHEGEYVMTELSFWGTNPLNSSIFLTQSYCMTSEKSNES